MSTQNKLLIRFDADSSDATVFDRDGNRTKLHDHRPYTKYVAEMNQTAEALDRFDEFGALTLSPDVFAQTPGLPYGIPQKSFHEGKNRLLKHQIHATEAFLRDLRGFGLLADVVGSGKTYEACSVLSELAAKGKISSLLLIVPGQVFHTWLEVLEIHFGLGRDVLCQLTDAPDASLLQRGEDGMYRPKRPMIVKSEDFADWQESRIRQVLFDAVIVDEAHNLCGEDGPEARCMKLLAVLMATKKKAHKTYCVLLSATPHAGNLEHMFRLWYFIRCKGGDPADFDEKDDAQRTETYRAEKKHYQTEVCRGAATVMEFIHNVRESEVLNTFGTEFAAFLAQHTATPYGQLLLSEKRKYIKTFLEENKAIHEKVNRRIASAYHNGVLRSIMIRQPDDGGRVAVSKSVENIFLLPCRSVPGAVKIRGFGNTTITVNTDRLDADDAIVTADGTAYDVDRYVEECRGNEDIGAAKARLFFDKGILQAMGVDGGSFQKQQSMQFYWESMEAALKTGGAHRSERVRIRFVPIGGADIFTVKMAELKSLLMRYAKERVLVFFDYDIPKDRRCYAEVLEALRADERFAGRILVGDSQNKVTTEEKFRATEDAVLVVTDRDFTEGANLQDSSVIVNFQVTPNPLAMEQRIGRIFRLGQDHDVHIYSLADMCDLEGYVLMYFTAIGLMTSNNGDAAIIAGSNNDNMITIRCEGCGGVRLLSRAEYEEMDKNDSDQIYCNATEMCTQNSTRGTKMTEVNSTEFKCTTCNVVVRREADDQYYCVAKNDSGSCAMCSEGMTGNRHYYCRKICAVSHCTRFTQGPMAGKCAALKYYQAHPNATDTRLAAECDRCAAAGQCYRDCRLTSGEASVMRCHDCREQHTCRPRPHVLAFNEQWTAPCPVCEARGQQGFLKPIVARTFETYIRAAFDYQQDNGQSFCTNLAAETKTVSEIRHILSDDIMSEGVNG